jgi:hypothetical protein
MVDRDVGVYLALQGKEVHPEEALEELDAVLDPPSGFMLIGHRLGREPAGLQALQHLLL